MPRGEILLYFKAASKLPKPEDGAKPLEGQEAEAALDAVRNTLDMLVKVRLRWPVPLAPTEASVPPRQAP